jgi:CRISPR-associated protein Csx17
LHRLSGCSPAPLAHYLKALGVLRIVGEQKDPAARGAWQGDEFVLLTTLDREALQRFFLDEYSPTPFVSPWNKGSGFFKDGTEFVEAIEKSTAPRFEAFRAGIRAASADTGIRAADQSVREFKGRIKALQKERRALTSSADARSVDGQLQSLKPLLAEAEHNFKDAKASLLPVCWQTWRGREVEWMAAALVLSDDGSASYPALLGSGGNDGRLDFTLNAMQRLAELFDLPAAAGGSRPASGALLGNALFSSPSRGVLPAAVGQFLPGGAGGANSSTGPDGDGQLNAWDFLFMLEGAVLFSASATRRLDPAASAKASAPFAVHGHATNYGSAAPGEESPRGEQWMPLWERPMVLGELRNLLAEGRAQVGAAPARQALDLARAISRLGVARGLVGFQRYAYLERNGQSTLAVPIGRIAVRANPRSALVDELAAWTHRLHRAARGKHAPARLIQVERRLSDALFDALIHEDEPRRWQAILLASAEVESVQGAGTAAEVGPIPPLRPEWVRACDDGSPEVRLALSLGLAAAQWSRGQAEDRVRHHWLPLNEWGNGFQFDGSDRKRLRKDVRVVAHGRDAVADCVALVERRLIESAQRSRRILPIAAAPRAGAEFADLAAWLAGQVDADRCLNLARAFQAIDARQWLASSIRLAGASTGTPIPEPWAALRLALLPFPLVEDRQIPADPAIVRRLDSGDAAGAIALALRRLSAAGVHSHLQAGTADARTSLRWASALAFPIHHRTAVRLLGSLDPRSRLEK